MGVRGLGRLKYPETHAGTHARTHTHTYTATPGPMVEVRVNSIASNTMAPDPVPGRFNIFRRAQLC